MKIKAVLVPGPQVWVCLEVAGSLRVKRGKQRFLAGSPFGLVFLWSLLLFTVPAQFSFIHSFNKHFNSLELLQIAVARAFQKRRLGLAEAPLPGASASRSAEAPACSAPRLHHPRSGARGLIGREARGDRAGAQNSFPDGWPRQPRTGYGARRLGRAVESLWGPSLCPGSADAGSE